MPYLLSARFCVSSPLRIFLLFICLLFSSSMRRCSAVLASALRRSSADHVSSLPRLYLVALFDRNWGLLGSLSSNIPSIALWRAAHRVNMTVLVVGNLLVPCSSCCLPESFDGLERWYCTFFNIMVSIVQYIVVWTGHYGEWPDICCGCESLLSNMSQLIAS